MTKKKNLFNKILSLNHFLDVKKNDETIVWKTISLRRPDRFIVLQVDHKRGLVIETMSAPNPFCPHTRGMCCLMLLLNLGLILVTLGIVIVVQFFQPVIVW